MKQLSDLLDEARADAPPARYGIDDVVAAGKRRKRRRTAGWAAVAAVAVAAAIGVPRIASPQAERAPVVDRPTAAPTVTPEFTFAGFRVGKLRVDDPTMWSLADESASIRRVGSSTIAASLHVYHPGVDPVPGGYRRQQPLADVKPANGRPAFQVQQARTNTEGMGILIGWEYADGAVATVEGLQGQLTRAELRQVAEAFTTGKHRPVPVAFTAASLPQDYQLVSVVFNPGGVLRSSVHVVAADQVAARLARPGRDQAPTEREEFIEIMVLAGDEVTVPQKLGCVDPDKPKESEQSGDVRGTFCQTPVGGGTAKLAVSSRYFGADDLRRVLAAAKAGDPDKPSTWWPVTEAIPASARPPAK